MRIWRLSLVFHKEDKRKYNFLLRNIPSDWSDKPGFLNFNIYDRIIENLNLAGKISKIPKYTYSILVDKCYAEKAKIFCGNGVEDDELDNEDWEEIHLRNLNVQSSLAFDPFISRFFIGILLFATYCLK